MILANEFNCPVRARKRELDAVVAVAAADMETSLSTVALFEKELAAWTGFAHSVGASSDTGCVSVMLGALGFRSGDEIIVSPDVPPWVIAPLLHAGLTLGVADYEPGTLRVCTASLARQIGSKTRALLVSSPFGFQQDFSALLALGRSKRVVTIIEMTETLGVTVDKRRIYDGFDIGLLSLKEGHSDLSTGEGGALLFRSPQWAQRAKSYSQFSDLDGLNPGVNHKLSGIQCAVGRLRIKALTARIVGYRDSAYRISTYCQQRGVSLLARPAGRMAGRAVVADKAAADAAGIPWRELPLLTHYLAPLANLAPEAARMAQAWCGMHVDEWGDDR